MIRPLTLLFIFVFILTSCTKKQSKSSVIVSTRSFYELKDASKADPHWSTKNELIAHLSSEPDILHPVNGNSSPRSEIFNYIHCPLIRLDVKSGQLIPVLTDTLPVISDDGKRYSFHLNENVRWDNGQSLLVDDIIFTAKVNKSILTANPALHNYWNNVVSIQKGKDDRSFELLLKEKTIQNISFLTSFPVMQRSFHDPNGVLDAVSFSMIDDTAWTTRASETVKEWSEKFNEAQNGRLPEMLNGLGDYKLIAWEQGQSIRLKKKERSPLGRDLTVVPDAISYRFIKDDQSALLAFRDGSIDVSTSLSLQNFFNLAADSIQQKNYSAVLMPTYSYTYLAMNEKPESSRQHYYTDVRTRRAMALLMPTDQILKTLYKEYGKECLRTSTHVSPLKKEYNSALKPLPNDPVRAKQLLKEAGWTDADRNGTLEKDGKEFMPELMYLNTSADWKDMATLIADAMRSAGIAVQLFPADLNLFLSKARSHDFDLILGSWNTTLLPEDYTQLWHTSSWKENGSNFTGFGNADSDALIDSLRRETDTQKRIILSHRLQQIIYDDQPYVFMYSGLRRNLIHERWGRRELFSERPGIYLDRLRLLTTGQGLLPETGVNP